MTLKEKFGGKCPYNGNPCETFNCNGCIVEAEERKAMEELDEEEKPLLEDVIDWGQGYDDTIMELLENFKKFRDGYYGLINYGDEWWENFNQGTDFDEIMKEQWEEFEKVDFMNIVEKMAVAIAGTYVRFDKFADGVKKCYEQGNGFRHREKEE